MHFGEPKLLTGLKLCCVTEFCAGGLGLITQTKLIGVTILLLLSVILKNHPPGSGKAGKCLSHDLKNYKIRD